MYQKPYCIWYNLNLCSLSLHIWLFLLVSCLSNFSPWTSAHLSQSSFELWNSFHLPLAASLLSSKFSTPSFLCADTSYSLCSVYCSIQHFIAFFLKTPETTLSQWCTVLPKNHYCTNKSTSCNERMVGH